MKPPATAQSNASAASGATPPLVVGGPLDPNSPESQAMAQGDPQAAGGARAPDPTTPPPAAAEGGAGAPPAAAPAAAPIVVNGRTFKDAAELAAYTSQLEQRHAAPPAPAPKTVELIDGKPIDQVMFDDPQRYHQYVVDKAKKEARDEFHAANTQQKQEQLFWDDFYQQNPDLSGLKDVVAGKLRDNFVEYSKLSRDDAAKKLAADSRSVVDRIKQQQGIQTTELPSRGASTLGTTGAAVPRVNTPERPKSFLEQVKAARRRA